MDLIGIIAIIVIITKIMNKAGEAAGKVERYGEPQNVWDQVIGQTQSKPHASAQSEQWKSMARENIEKAKKRALKTLSEVEHTLEINNKPVSNTSILERAIKNVNEDKVDIT